jgi:anti-sigma B factor antagonist
MSEYPPPEQGAVEREHKARLSASRRVSDDAVVVSVIGDIDMSTAARFGAALATAFDMALAHPARLLIVDLDGVDFFGSTGLTAALDCHQRGLDAAVDVRLVATSPLVLRPIEVTRLDRILALYPSVGAAILAGHPDVAR